MDRPSTARNRPRPLLCLWIAAGLLPGCADRRAADPGSPPVVAPIDATAPASSPNEQESPKDSNVRDVVSAADGTTTEHAASASDEATPAADAKTADGKWINLFDGETLGNWIATRFGGEGEVTVEDGTIVMDVGDDMTGVTWKEDPPAKMNYELELEAQRVAGSDFFCGLTFPVGDKPCSLICGGWGGGMTGLSSLDGNDASQNETSQWISYANGRWYRIRLRVTDAKIEAWLDDKQIVNVETANRHIGIRPEVDASRPLGVATWRTKGAIRKIRLRKLGAESTEAATTTRKDATMRAQKFIDAHVAKLKPLERDSAIAWWDANISGADEDFKRKEEAQNRIDAALSDRQTFAEIKEIRDQAGIADPLVKRQIDVLYLQYLEKQVDPELLKRTVEKANAVEKAFNVFRAKVDGKELSENDVRKILKQSKSSDERRAAWQGSKGVGAVVESDLKELVRLRNQAATQLGFKNFHQMMMFLAEQDQARVIRLFDELDELTRDPFRAAKAEIDERLAAQCGVTVAELRPWHYHDPFFQESPAVFGVDIDAVYESSDILELCREFYAGIGLPIEDVLQRSDLYEKPGKSPHAFCTDIDREGDVRVLANIVPSDRWMDTMLHELGHAVYSSKNIPRSVPYVLRGEAHILTTEGVAMLFGRLSKNGAWQEKMGIAPKEAEERARLSEAAAKVLRNQLLIFSRWCQVMLRFEKGLYENPDQDLNKLWWDLVEKYQLVRRPEDRNAPDYASKIHVVSAPVYYHNYMMGELFASQVHHAIVRELYAGSDPRAVAYVGNRAVGEFMDRRVFDPGRTLNWNELTKHATGAELSPKAFAEDFRP